MHSSTRGGFAWHVVLAIVVVALIAVGIVGYGWHSERQLSGLYEEGLAAERAQDWSGAIQTWRGLV